MSIASVTARGRAMAEARMLDSCVVTRQTGATTDPVTGVVTPNTTVIYSGRCRIRQAATSTAPALVGEAAQYIQSTTLSLPIGAPVLQSDDAVQVTASALTPPLVGRRFHVRGIGGGDTSATAGRYDVSEVTG